MKTEFFEPIPILKPYVHSIRNIEFSEHEVLGESLAPHPLVGLILQHGQKAQYTLFSQVPINFPPNYFAFPMLSKHKLNFRTVGHYKAVIVLFKPGGFNALFSCPLIHCSTEPIIDYDLVLSQCQKVPLNWFQDDSICLNQRILMLQQALASLISTQGKMNYISLVAQHIFDQKGVVDLNHLTRHFGVSLRSLERHFMHEQGISPCYYSRVVRCHSVLNEIIKLAKPDWLDLVVRYKYHDKPHLVNDFKKIIGHSPSKFLKMNAVMEQITRSIEETGR